MRTWLLALLFVLPAVAAQDTGIQNPTTPAETTMYVHMGVPQDFPINTQQPDDRYEVSQGRGLTTSTATCVPDAAPGLVRGDFHTWYGFSSPGYVQYDVDEGNKPRIHPERGLSYDVDFDTEQPIRLRWYVESQLLGAETAEANSVPAVLPNVVLQATIREGDEISVDHEKMNTGRVIAQARTDPALLAGPATADHAQVTYMPIQQGGQTKHVYEFALDLPFADPSRSPQVPKDESFNLRVDLIVENPACDDPPAEQRFMPNSVRLHSSPGHRPSFTWDVLEAVRIEVLHPQFIGDDLVIHTQANSPWGNYDVRGDLANETGGYTLDIVGPTTPRSLQLAFFDVDTGGHDHHTDAVSATWVWPYVAEQAADGEYTVLVTVLNDQETATSTAVATFTLGDDAEVCSPDENGGAACTEIRSTKEKTTPAPALGLLLAGLAAAVWRRR